MKSKIFLSVNLLLCFSMIALAQEIPNSERKTAGFKTSFAKNGAESNWFIHLGAGAQTILGDDNDKANFSKRITLAPVASVGKWVTPYWGFRLKGQGGVLHGFENKGLYMQHNRYYNVHWDALWNLSNYWGAYSENNVFNLTPYIGLGYAHRFQLKENVLLPPGATSDYRKFAGAISANGGLQFGFRLSKRLNLDFDLGVAAVPDYFDRVVKGGEYDIIAAATGGLTFKLGKTNFETITPFNPEIVEKLNNEVNRLRDEIALLSKKHPQPCPECPDVVPVPTPVSSGEINYIPNVVFFRINSAKVEENQQISIFNTSEFLKHNGEKIKVIGYADKGSGSDTYNLNLSEKRAKAVAKELISKYDVPSQKIVVEWKGSEEQPYTENKWNRVVIMSVD